MAIVTRKVEFYKCDKCEHEWVARKKIKPEWSKGKKKEVTLLPKMCPHCKTTYWNVNSAYVKKLVNK